MQKFLQTFWAAHRNHVDVLFFYGFLLTLPLTVRKVIGQFSFTGEFNEYMSTYVYASDIFLILTIFTWIILSNKSLLLSSIAQNLRKPSILFPLLFVIWSSLSMLWSDNQQLALFRSIKFFEFFLLYIYFSRRIVPRGTFLKYSLISITITGTINALIGTLQFILQKSLGLRFFRESILSTDIPGVAEVILKGEPVLRAYGLLPHPNILAGFLIFSLFAGFMAFRTVPRGTVKYRVFLLIVAVQAIGLLLTFSKSAFLALIVSGAYLVFQKVNMERMKELFHVKHYIALFGAIVLILFSFGNTLNFEKFVLQPFSERIEYNLIAVETIYDNLLFGVGNGNFVSVMTDHSETQLEKWQFQPIHNIYLLIAAEVGLIGFLLFFLFIYTIAKSVPRGTSIGNSMPTALFIGLLIIGIFDHYLWDIQQGSLIFWIGLGLLSLRE